MVQAPAPGRPLVWSRMSPGVLLCPARDTGRCGLGALWPRAGGVASRLRRLFHNVPPADSCWTPVRHSVDRRPCPVDQCVSIGRACRSLFVAAGGGGATGPRRCTFGHDRPTSAGLAAAGMRAQLLTPGCNRLAAGGLGLDGQRVLDRRDMLAPTPLPCGMARALVRGALDHKLDPAPCALRTLGATSQRFPLRVLI